MASPIENLDKLQGEKVYDQDGRSLGEIDHVYGVGEGGVPMWVTLATSQGVGSGRAVFVPMARLKEEDGALRVPYSIAHLQESPEVEVADEVSEEQDRALRDFYAVDLADDEVRTDHVSYAAQVPDDEGRAQKLSDS